MQTTPDRLLTLDEIADRMRMPVASVRWKRSRGDLPFVFRLGRRLVGYESECDAYIASQREADRIGA